MQRWHIPFDYMDSHWTPSHMVCLTAAVIENAKDDARDSKGGRRGKSMKQFTAEQDRKAKAEDHGNTSR